MSRTPRRNNLMSPKLQRVIQAAQKNPKVQFGYVPGPSADGGSVPRSLEAPEQGGRGRDRPGDGQDLRAGPGGQPPEPAREGQGYAGAYRALPSRRVYIPKLSGGQRAIAVPAMEDKIVQGAVRILLEAVFEQDFLPFSYGFRPGRSPHQAVQALRDAIQYGRMSWVLDADIAGFFDRYARPRVASKVCGSSDQRPDPPEADR